MSLLLAIESSCDEMAMAVLKDQREFLSSVVASQIDIHAMYGGVVPEIASRKHVECVSVVLKETLKQAKVKMEDIDAICVTKGPGLVGSLHIGLQVAKTLSLAYKKPLIGVHHIAGHIYANNYEKDIVYPALCLVVSGGHTELVLMKHPYSFEVIGETLDDAVGEAYDKVGRVLNLPYPGGPVLDKMAHLGNANYPLPKPLDDDSYNFSFSGLKSAVINLAHNHKQKGLEINQNDLMHYLDTINEYQSQGMLTIDGKLKLGKALGDGLEHREFYADAASIEQIVKKLYPLMEQPKTNK